MKTIIDAEIAEKYNMPNNDETLEFLINIKESADKEHGIKIFRKFWKDRADFENWLKEYKKQQHILFLKNHIKFLENWHKEERQL